MLQFTARKHHHHRIYSTNLEIWTIQHRFSFTFYLIFLFKILLHSFVSCETDVLVQTSRDHFSNTICYKHFYQCNKRTLHINKQLNLNYSLPQQVSERTLLQRWQKKLTWENRPRCPIRCFNLVLSDIATNYIPLSLYI